jgi:hypothetical protein
MQCQKVQMKIFGKLLHKLHDFPEYKDLEQEISELQTLDSKILAGLQQAFGPSMNDFARLHSAKLREVLINLQDIGRAEVLELRNLLSSTASLPADLRVLSQYHDGITQKRTDLHTNSETYEKLKRDADQAMATIESKRKSQASASEIAKAQTTYDTLCAKKQMAFEVLQRLREETERAEIEYRKTVMQVTIAAFESFSIAHVSAMNEIVKSAEQMKGAASSIDDDFEDPAIAELEGMLKLLEDELNDDPSGI